VLLAPAAAQAAKPNVVVMIFDEFPSTSLLGKNHRVDAARYPNFAALARGSTWFRNATSVSDTTFSAVPSILDGRLHRWKVGERAHPPKRAIWDLLRAHGYSIHAATEAPVCPARYCGPRVPTRTLLIRRREARFQSFVGSIRPGRRPGLWLKHTLQPHEPWIYLPSGHQYLRGPTPPLPGLNSERGKDSRWLVRLAYQRHLLQVGNVDRELGQLIARLKATQMYDKTLLVVTADHGISFRLHERDRRTVTPRNLQGEAPVPLFVKLPRQRHGRTSRAWARTVDILPTIAGALHLRVPWRMSGRSAFSRAVRRRHTVRMSSRAPASPVVRMSTRAFSFRWRRAIRYKLSTFGYGNRGPGLYGIGPSRALVGRTASALRAHRGKVRAGFFFRRELLNVRLGSYFRPSLICGRLHGGRRGATRELAVVVNGRVAATGRSFHLAGGPESFAVLVPEIAFGGGANHVELLSVARRRGRLSSARLGRV
jgi:Sulfatase